MHSSTGKKYNRRDLLDISKRLELDMEAFYRVLSVKFPEKRELIEAFAEEEANHATLAENLLSLTTDCETEDEKNRISEVMAIFERSEYLPKAGDMIESIKNLKTVGEGMRLSSEMERRVELFYCQIAPYFDPHEKKILYDLILTEHKHRLQVEEMSELTGGAF